MAARAYTPAVHDHVTITRQGPAGRKNVWTGVVERVGSYGFDLLDDVHGRRFVADTASLAAHDITQTITRTQPAT